MWVRPLADADASCGGKAHGLARLIAAGLPVPDGIVVEAAAFAHLAPATHDAPLDDIGHRLAEIAAHIATAALPGAFTRAVDDGVARLGDALAVRSSSAIEDREGGAAAGVFSSQTAVAPGQVWAAIRAVWTSALTPLAAAYARRRHAALAIAVIVQRSVPGERATIYTRPPGRAADDHVWIQRGEAVVVAPRGSGDPRVALALAAERAIGATEGADVELVLDGDRAWLVQARPIVHPRAIPARRPAPPIVTAQLDDGRTWTWDIAHNPDPLSPAQQGLVERVERAEVAPWSMRVCAGYLYTAPRSVERPPPPTTPAELTARAADIERRLASTLVAEPELGEALERYVAFYKIWASELVPAISAARARTPVRPGARASAVERTLLRAAAGELDEATALRELGDLAPAWDVAVATYGERPEVVRAAIAHARRRHAEVGAERGQELGELPAGLVERSPHDAELLVPDRDAELGELAADLAERDDAWFARAQAMVRRAILARSRQLGVADDDACWLSLEDLVGGIDDVTATRRASAARAAAANAAKWQMPLVVPSQPDDLANRDERLRGIGTGGRVVGRVVRYGSLAAACGVGPTDVIVTRAVTPALAVFVVGCAGLVSETGGPLDHGAAMARELSIPCVVGCRDAMAKLADGMIVTVDGDAGTVDVTP